ncbi:MAG TPA: histidinol-phosphate transaminase [Bacteroidota bacterium]|nr:histidinol-phosphate transaminase [Bacteroidota bacterium]
MSLVPPYIESLQAYVPGKPIDEVRRELGLGKVIKLASNENPFGPSPMAVAALEPRFGELHLYPNGGYDLRVRLAGLYKLSPENVIAGSGSEAIMATIIRTFLNDDDEVLTTEAAFIGFQVLAKSRGVPYRTVPYREWRYDLNAIAGAITKRTKIIYLANPNNPTGTVFTREEFDAFYRRVPERVLIIMDEAYWEYARDDAEFPDSMKYRYDNVITLRTFSKVYGLAGLRIGYGFAHAELIRNLLKVKLPFEPSTLAQAAGLAALEDGGFVERTLANNREGRDYLTGALKELGLDVAHSRANFVMFPLRDEEEVNRVYDGMLRQGVIVRPLRGFGLPRCIRITVGTREENRAAIGALGTVLRARHDSHARHAPHAPQ